MSDPIGALVAAREAAGVSREQLAAVLGIGPTQLSRYETGRVVPSPRRLASWRLALAAITGTDDRCARCRCRPARLIGDTCPTCWLPDVVYRVATERPGPLDWALVDLDDHQVPPRCRWWTATGGTQ